MNGLTDNEEFTYGNLLKQNPCVYDTDGNGTSDGDQFLSITSDTDSDGLRDTWELTYFGNITAYGGGDDPDSDSLTNTQEYPINTGTVNYPGTNPMDPDTDRDGLSDSMEYVTVFDSNPSNNLNPNNPDTDVDGLYDGFNSFTGIGENSIPAPYTACDTNPLAQDSDADRISDSSELVVNWSSSVNGAAQSETFVLNPCVPDTDGDTLYDGMNSLGVGEMLYTNPAYPSCKTHPNRADTDGDGLSDSGEITAGTNPCHSDTDGDGLSDGLEIALKAVYPTLSATDADSDDDFFTDKDEYCDRNAGTDVPGGYVNPKAVCAASTDPAWDTSPIVADTDGDGRLDGNERNQSADPFFITNPMVADTDEDGVSDGQEMINGTKPNNKITVNVTALTTVNKADKQNDPALAQTITVTVTNNNPSPTTGSTEPIVLYWKTTQGTTSVVNAGKTYPFATGGITDSFDYVTVNGTVVTGVNPITIPAGTASTTLTVGIWGDNQKVDKYFYVDILHPGDSFGTTAAKRMTNAKLGTSRGFVIIDDRDS